MQGSNNKDKRPKQLNQSGARPLPEDTLDSERANQGKQTKVHKDSNTSNLQNAVYSCPVDHTGTNVYLKGWVQPQTEDPPLLFIHDLGESVGRYREFCLRMGQEGYSIYGFDLRGHGRSGRLLGHIPDFEALTKDLLQVVAWIRFKSDRRVPILVGQGIGALILIYFQRHYPQYCTSAILAAPCLSFETSVPVVKRLMIRILAEISPTVRLPKALTPRFLIPDPAKPRSTAGGTTFQAFHGITANFANEVMKAIGDVSDVFKGFQVPSLILCPEGDVRYQYSQLFEMIGRHPKKDIFQVQEIKMKGHQVLTNPDELEKVVDLMLPWLREQIANSNNKPVKPVPNPFKEFIDEPSSN